MNWHQPAFVQYVVHRLQELNCSWVCNIQLSSGSQQGSYTSCSGEALDDIHASDLGWFVSCQRVSKQSFIEKARIN